MRIHLTSKQWKSGPKRKSVSQKIAERKSKKVKVKKGKRMGKFEEATAAFKKAAECEHELSFEGWSQTGGQYHRCGKCGCRFTSWEGGMYFDDERVRVEAKEDKR